MGVLAVYGYEVPVAVGENSKELNEVIQKVCFSIINYENEKLYTYIYHLVLS